ncbi:MAG TPA: M23 family metallopeptidase [Candidatus Eisenbacteria bacterium]|jgi:murein DD-endopeptidase MepM/ murein hydrolase activator NlpD
MRRRVRALAGTLAFGVALASPPHAAPAARHAAAAARHAVATARAAPPAAAKWGWSGAWLLPVGDRYELGKPGPGRVLPYRVNRGVGAPEEGGSRHAGADLSNGRGGDVVRAAAEGLVIEAEAHGWHGGYGRHVVIAHRLEDGTRVYSVYAHLAPDSLRVRVGQRVAAGQVLGHVGRSGRASSEHLHFEVRQVNDPAEPWQKCKVLDPVPFVEARLPAVRAETSAVAPYLEWARCAALVASEDRGDSLLSRGAWWRMLARSARVDRDDLPDTPDGLRQMLTAAGVLPASVARADASALSWKEMTRDLERLRKVGTAVARPPLTTSAHRAQCQNRLSSPRPADALERLSERKGEPRIADACLLLADVVDPWAVVKKTKKRPPPPATRPATGEPLRAVSVERDSS